VTAPQAAAGAGDDRDAVVETNAHGLAAFLGPWPYTSAFPGASIRRGPNSGDRADLRKWAFHEGRLILLQQRAIEAPGAAASESDIQGIQNKIESPPCPPFASG